MYKTKVFLFIATLIHSLPGHAQAPQRLTPQEEADYKTLHLDDAVEIGLRLNFEQKQRQYTQNILELDYQDSWENFHFPQLELSLETNPQRVAHLWEGKNQAKPNSEAPKGSLAFGFKDYNLFNWGKDYLHFLNTKANYHKASRQLRGKKRNLRHKIILQYFELLLYEKVLKARKKQLQHASFIYRYSKEKIALRKMGRQEYYQARSQYLQAQNDYQLAKSERKVENQEMAILLADKTDSYYLLQNDLHYTRLKLTLTEALKLGEKKNPSIVNSQTDLANSRRDYQIQLKENLPLPKLELSLSTYTHSLEASHPVQRSPVDLLISVKATWPLTGGGGFLNRRQTQKSLLLKAQAQTVWPKLAIQLNRLLKKYLPILDI